MKVLEYKVEFVTPAFLGNADQAGQWRTPPFKAQLRQWWRVAYAARKQFKPDMAAMRREEGKFFGVAADGGESSKSQVRIRLSHWNDGKQKNWNDGKQKNWDRLEQGRVTHPEVMNNEGISMPIGAHLYLGYGPLEIIAGATALKKNAAIQAGEQARFSLAIPDVEIPLLEQALWLMDRFGAVGGRSRNGWGSYLLTPQSEVPGLTGVLPVRPWREALALDWPHALGEDSKGALIWQTRSVTDWSALMRTLAEIKIGLRTQFTFTPGRDPLRVDSRHWLSYPVTNHSVKAWGNNARLPNSLRFKVRPAPNDAGKVVGVIFHVPCLPPAQFTPDRHAIEAVWQQVHGFLDEPAQKLTRIPA